MAHTMAMNSTNMTHHHTAMPNMSMPHHTGSHGGGHGTGGMHGTHPMSGHGTHPMGGQHSMPGGHGIGHMVRSIL
jgi:hypothetical protein